VYPLGSDVFVRVAEFVIVLAMVGDMVCVLVEVNVSVEKGVTCSGIGKGLPTGMAPGGAQAENDAIIIIAGQTNLNFLFTFPPLRLTIPINPVNALDRAEQSPQFP
jgi:hypothetical protein